MENKTRNSPVALRALLLSGSFPRPDHGFFPPFFLAEDLPDDLKAFFLNVLLFGGINVVLS
ncbi:MAG: hypothetical protein ACLFS0_02665 [Bacteroidales bacterium]